MQTIKTILARLGIDSVDDLAVNECYRLENPPFQPLTIEKVGDHRLSVAHVQEFREDLLVDPEIVFDTSGGTWTAVMIQQDPVERFERDDTGLPDVDAFAEQWSDNLRAQGFLDAAADHDGSPVTAEESD